jgi:hypothetical protein
MDEIKQEIALIRQEIMNMHKLYLFDIVRGSCVIVALLCLVIFLIVH